jgi:hypothetical protein
VQQLYLADVLARPQGGHNQLRPVRIVQHHLDTPLGDDVELVGGSPSWMMIAPGAKDRGSRW